VIAFALALLLLAACGPLVEGRDYWIGQRTRTITARSAAVAEALCALRGADPEVAVARARNFAAGHGSEPMSGCYDARDDIVVVSEDPAAPVAGIRAHEDAHRRGEGHE